MQRKRIGFYSGRLMQNMDDKERKKMGLQPFGKAINADVELDKIAGVTKETIHSAKGPLHKSVQTPDNYMSGGE